MEAEGRAVAMARFGDAVRDLDLGGTFRGVVVNRVDPRGEGRLGVFLPALFTEAPAQTETPAPGVTVLPQALFENQGDLGVAQSVKTDNYIWARPAAFLVENGRAADNAGGGYRVPRLGTVVRVYFESADPNKPYWEPFTLTVNGDVVAGRELGKGTNVTNAAASWRDPAKKPDIDVIREYDSGNVIYVDGNADNNALVIRWANGHTLSIGHAAESGIVLQTQKGHLVQLDENSAEIRIRTQSGNSSVVLKDDGTVVIRNSSTTLLQSGGAVTIRAPAINLNP